MKCPYCGFSDSKVIDSRSGRGGTRIRRRRECLSCAKRFTTYETIETESLHVVKRDGSRESYDKHKLRNGIFIACKKRPIPAERIDEIVQRVTDQVQQFHAPEVETQIIGSLVMEELRNLDEIAYVRFASVYRKFTDTDEFIKELNGLKNV